MLQEVIHPDYSEALSNWIKFTQLFRLHHHQRQNLKKFFDVQLNKMEELDNFTNKNEGPFETINRILYNLQMKLKERRSCNLYTEPTSKLIADIRKILYLLKKELSILGIYSLSGPDAFDDRDTNFLVLPKKTPPTPPPLKCAKPSSIASTKIKVEFSVNTLSELESVHSLLSQLQSLPPSKSNEDTSSSLPPSKSNEESNSNVKENTSNFSDYFPSPSERKFLPLPKSSSSEDRPPLESIPGGAESNSSNFSYYAPPLESQLQSSPLESKMEKILTERQQLDCQIDDAVRGANKRFYL